MNISSLAFTDHEMMPAKYTCDGQNINPPLAISNIPEGAKSLALIVDDPDAPAGTWIHWLVWDIDPHTFDIAEDSVPEDAVEGITTYRRPGYGGPCPPSGTHRYFFKVYALDVVLDLPASSEKADLESAMTGHILANAEIVGLYSRQR